MLYPRACPIPPLARNNRDEESGWQTSPARLPWESALVDARIFFGFTAAVHATFVHRGCEPYVRPGLVQPDLTLGDRALWASLVFLRRAPELIQEAASIFSIKMRLARFESG
jgi:hypothetical protein